MIIERRKDPTMLRWGTIAEQRELPHLLSQWKPGILPHPLTVGDYEETCFCCNTALCNRDIQQLETAGGLIRVTTPNREMIRVVNQKIIRQGRGAFDTTTCYGTEERVVIGKSHAAWLTDLSAVLLEESLRVCRDRMTDLTKDLNLANIIIWNAGQVEHDGLPCHPQWHIESEITAFQRTVEEATAYWLYTFSALGKERCLMCDILRDELSMQQLVIFQNDSYAVISPFASRYPFELWIVPKQHQPYFERSADMHNLASAITEMFSRMHRVLQGYVPYTLVLHNAPLKLTGTHLPERPTRDQIEQMFHWFLRFKPFLGVQSITEEAAREDATSEAINPLSPEAVAKLLSTSI